MPEGMSFLQRLRALASQILLAPAILGVATAAYTAPPDPSPLVTVTAVIDGDTIDVVPGGRIRLLGIDAPEIGGRYEHPAPFAREARDRLAGMVFRRVVRVEYDGERRDDYGRTLAYVVTEQGDCINTLLVREGLARVSARRRLARLDALQQAEVDARRTRRGLWGTPPPDSGDVRITVPSRADAPKEANRTRCVALTKAGVRCRRAALSGERYCAQHRAAQRNR